MEIDQCLRCNSCFLGHDKNKNSPFSLTACDHIFCRKCLGPGENQCRYCKITNISSMPLMDSVSPEVKYIFKPLEESFEKLRLAFVFQKTQSKITHQRLFDLEKKHAYMSSEYIRIIQENNSLKTELMLTQQSLDKYKNFFIGNALLGTSPSMSSTSAGEESNEIKRPSLCVTLHKPKVQMQIKNGIIAKTPANQRLQTLSTAPVILKKQKAKKRIDHKEGK